LFSSFDSAGVCLPDGSTFVDLSNQGGENAVENLVPDGEHFVMQEEVHVEPEADLGQDSALNQPSPGL
jgi:hypothetical protein